MRDQAVFSPWIFGDSKMRINVQRLDPDLDQVKWE